MEIGTQEWKDETIEKLSKMVTQFMSAGLDMKAYHLSKTIDEIKTYLNTSTLNEAKN